MNKQNNIVDFGDRGKFNHNNKLNNLTGKEWIKFTKSWFIHKPKKRNNEEILHPAKFPESLVEEFISFFTKENDWVFDPFLGTGSTLIASGNLNRNAIGIELIAKYHKISLKRIKENNFENSVIALKGNSSILLELFDKNNFTRKIDFTITSPPYWNQLERNSIRQKKRNENGLDTKYSQEKSDLGNINNYDEFLEAQAIIFDQVYDITKDKGYLAIITNNIFFQSKIFPLAFDTAVSLTKRGNKSWVLKDEKIWLQDDKPLIALGVNSAWVGNRHHQYCLIFRKES
ncbi:MAG: site-specific DNA-methyltransferase [Ignavibacteriae bacterium]|nr:site-specific DNA-methyltransferase [Ignavibacteriota bacterium]